MSRDTGLDAGGDAVLLRRQVELLQEEVTRLRLKGEDPSRERAEPGRKLSNGSVGDSVKSEKVSQSGKLLVPVQGSINRQVGSGQERF